MPNSIELPHGYENVLMEAYRKESLTAVWRAPRPRATSRRWSSWASSTIPCTAWAAWAT